MSIAIDYPITSILLPTLGTISGCPTLPHLDDKIEWGGLVRPHKLYWGEAFHWLDFIIQQAVFEKHLEFKHSKISPRAMSPQHITS